MTYCVVTSLLVTTSQKPLKPIFLGYFSFLVIVSPSSTSANGLNLIRLSPSYVSLTLSKLVSAFVF